MAFFSKLDHYFILWNPATSLFKKILPPKSSVLNLEQNSDLCGFCWDSVHNDFKLVDVCLESSQAVVFSCKMDCWSDEVVSVDSCIPWPKYRHPSPTIILEGIPYWELSDGVILEFDPRYNFFTYFVVPNVSLSYSLLNWKDCLALVQYNLDGIMHVYRYFKEYGQGLTLCTIEYNVWKNKFAPYPMCFRYGGEIVFNGMSNLYDPRSKRIKNIGYHYDHVHGFSYTPSLVSLEGMKPLQPKITEDRLPLTRQCGRKWVKRFNGFIEEESNSKPTICSCRKMAQTYRNFLSSVKQLWFAISQGIVGDIFWELISIFRR